MIFRFLVPLALVLGEAFTQKAGANTLNDLFEAKTWRRGNWDAVTEEFGVSSGSHIHLDAFEVLWLRLIKMKNKINIR